MRVKGEYPLTVMERMFGTAAVCYRGIAKNADCFMFHFWRDEHCYCGRRRMPDDSGIGQIEHNPAPMATQEPTRRSGLSLPYVNENLK